MKLNLLSLSLGSYHVNFSYLWFRKEGSRPTSKRYNKLLCRRKYTTPKTTKELQRLTRRLATLKLIHFTNNKQVWKQHLVKKVRNWVSMKNIYTIIKILLITQFYIKYSNSYWIKWHLFIQVKWVCQNWSTCLDTNNELAHFRLIAG